MGSGGTGASPGANETARRFGPWRREVRAYLELLALAGIAIAQPALDLLGKNSTVFVSRRSSPSEIVVLALFVVLIPPLVLWAVEVVAGLVMPAVRRYVHAASAALMAGIVVVEVINRLRTVTTVALVIPAIVGGLVAGWIVLRSSVARLFLRYLAIAPVAFLLLFLFSSPATQLVLDEGPSSGMDVQVGKPSRVVVLVMDELPIESFLDGTGHIDRALYPNVAALADTSTWYRNDTTVAPNTNEAVPAILSGTYPEQAALPTAFNYPTNLFTLLGKHYRLNVQETISHLCPTTMCPHEEPTSEGPSGFAGLLSDTWDLWRNFASLEGRQAALNFNFDQETHFAPDAYERGLRFVRSLQPSRGPELDFLHALLPHRPWHYIGDGQSYDPVNVPGTRNTAWVDQSVADSARQRHLLQAQAADRLVGDLVARLKQIGEYSRSLVVVTADHGVAFTAHNPIRGASAGNYPEIMWPPLFVKAPNQTAGVVDDKAVRSIDVLPTIADKLDVTPGPSVDGRSMLGKTPHRGQPRLLNWTFNRLRPPPGQEYVTVDGAAGFRAAMAGRASSATGDPALRLYKLGPYGDLVGRSAAPPLLGTAAGITARVVKPQTFVDVDPTAKHAPWTYLRGHVDARIGPAPIAVAINGVVGAVVQPFRPPGGHPRQLGFWGALPPQLFRAGRNDVRLYEVTGPPTAPVLRPLG